MNLFAHLRLIIRNAWTSLKREQDMKQSTGILALLAAIAFIAQHRISQRLLRRSSVFKFYQSIPSTYSLIVMYGKKACIGLLFPVLACFVHSALKYKPPTEAELAAAQKISTNHGQDLTDYLRSDAELAAVQKISKNRNQDLRTYLCSAYKQNTLFLSRLIRLDAKTKKFVVHSPPEAGKIKTSDTPWADFEDRLACDPILKQIKSVKQCSPPDSITDALIVLTGVLVYQLEFFHRATAAHYREPHVEVDAFEREDLISIYLSTR